MLKFDVFIDFMEPKRLNDNKKVYKIHTYQSCFIDEKRKKLVLLSFFFVIEIHV